MTYSVPAVARDGIFTKRGVVPNYHVSESRQRPERFELDYSHPLLRGCVFAGLGNSPGSVKYWDSSSKKNNGALTGMVPAEDWVWVPELGRWGLDFDGSNDYVNCGTRESLKPSQLTLSFFARTNDYTRSLNGGVAQGFVHGGPSEYSYAISLASSNAGIAISNQSSSKSVVIAIGDNNWHRWTLTYDGINLRAYKDTVLGGTVAASSIWYGTANVNFGIGGRVASPVFSLLGQLADITVHSRALTPAEIRQLADPTNAMLSGAIQEPRRRYFPGVQLSDAYTLQHNIPAVHVSGGNQRPEHFDLNYSHPLAKGLVFAGLGRAPGSVRYWDSSTKKNNGTLTSMDPPTDWTWVPELGRWGLDFDGDTSGDYVNVPASESLYPPSAVSISAWIIRRSGADSTETICKKNLTAILRYSSSSSLIQAYFWPISGLRYNISASAASLDGLQHVAVTIPPNTYGAIIYRNGQPLSTTVTTSAGTRANTESLTIGGESTNAEQFAGTISDHLIHSRALTPAEIQTLANPSDPMLSGLILPRHRGPKPIAINDRHWVGRTTDYHDANNWSRSRGGKGQAGVPRSDHNIILDTTLPEYPED